MIKYTLSLYTQFVYDEIRSLKCRAAFELQGDSEVAKVL